MDTRTPLKPGERLIFPGMVCEIEKIIGKGSNAIVYIGRYADALNTNLFHSVLIKELFPYHTDNLIYRNADNTICISENAKEYFELQKLSFERGNEIHLRMLEKHPDKIGSNINTFCSNGTYYSVMGFDAGKTLDKSYIYKEKNLRNIAVLLNNLIDAVEIFHSAGYLHLDISPDNVLMIGEDKSERIYLIDYNSVHRVEEFKNDSPFYYSIKDGYTAPEVRARNLPAICEATDIYSVTAVFYWLLTGKPLSLYQSLCKNPPNVRSCSLLAEQPDTVVSQVELILRRGLSSLPERRYRSCESIKNDVAELLLRIDGIGITHVALWESGRRSAAKMIKLNPSFAHIAKEDSLYPMRAITSNNENLLLNEAVEKQFTQGSAVLYGPAGIGKTTALLYTAFTRSRHYSPIRPVFIYVSLFGYNSSGENFIKNRILEDLRFDANVRSMEDARSRLVKVFRETIRTGDKAIPKYVLLIDGFNEANGDTEPLRREILSLSALDGVSLFLTSRGKSDLLPFASMELAPLHAKDVDDILLKYSLAVPESDTVKELLKTPLMLSIFCKAALNSHKQIQCNSADELLNEYLSGLCEKENLSLSENSSHNWIVDAAVNFVLPYICSVVADKHTAISDADLLKTVKKCFHLLSSSRMPYIFPQYIGHSTEIINHAGNAEQWYGMVVIDILWRKMGLLIKEPGRGYKVMHQLLQEYLQKTYQSINGKVRKQNAIIASASGFSFAALLLIFISILKPNPYDTELAKSYLDSLVVAQVQTGGEISGLTELLQADVSDSFHFQLTMSRLKQNLDMHKRIIANGISGSALMTQKIYDNLEKTGKVMPWSSEKINQSYTNYLFELGENTAENYGLYADILDFLNSNEDMNEKYGKEFRTLLSEKLSADAALSDALFHLTCIIHLAEMENADSDAYQYYWLTIANNADLSELDPEQPNAASIEKLRKACDAKTFELNAHEIFTVFRRVTQ